MLKKNLLAISGIGIGLFIGPMHGSAFADHTKAHHSHTDGNIEGGWVVQIPAGSSDYFNVRFDYGAVVTHSSSLSVSVADFGASSSYARIGVYAPNLGLDASGNTPDLSSPYTSMASPSGALGNPQFDFVCLSMPIGFPTGTFHAVVQFPPGDSGLLGVGADTDTTALGGGESPGSPNPFDSSFFSSDGYSTPAAAFTAGDFGMNWPNPLTIWAQDIKLKDGILKAQGAQALGGDFDTLTTRAHEPFGLLCGGLDQGGTPLWILFLSFLGVPVAPASPVLPLIPTGSGEVYLRVGGTWPSGFGNLTLNFVAMIGAAGVPGSVGLTNEITLHVLPDPIVPGFGCYDDGTYETGWVVSIPSGSSDYFNVNHGDAAAAGMTGLNGQRIAVMDFGTSVSSFPYSGATAENTGVDPSGNTPDLGSPYITQPFAFPALTFCTTSGQMIAASYATFAPTTPNLHGLVQFPIGDSGLLGVGGDTNSTFISGLSGWTLDGYSTPSNLFSANWGMCTDGF